MDNKGITVVFDTNSYRQFVKNKNRDEVNLVIGKLIEAESKRDIQCSGSVIAAMELLGHLTDKDNLANYEECLNGAILMANHSFDRAKAMPNILPHAYLQITHVLFQTIPSDVEQKVISLGGVLNDLKNDLNKALEHHKSHSTFDTIKQYLETLENEFVKQILDLITGIEQIIKNDYPTISSKHLREKKLDYINNGSLQNVMSKGIVSAMASKIGLQITEQEIEKMALFMNKTYPVSSGFYRWICNEIVDKNLDMYSKTSMSKRWNWLWDYHISFIVSNSTLNGKNGLLVTSDGDLTKILSEYGFGSKVMELTDYLKYIDYQD